MLHLNKQKVLDIANFMLENKAYLADIAKEFNMSIRTAGKYVNEYLKEVDENKYNELKKSLKTNDFSKRKISKNATDIFDYILDNKDKVTLEDLAEKNCCCTTLKKYLRNPYLKSIYPRFNEMKQVADKLILDGSGAVSRKNSISNKILKLADYVIKYKASITDVSKEFNLSERSVREYLKHTLKGIDEEKYYKVNSILEENKKVNRRKKVISLSKKYYDYIIEHHCKISTLARNLNLTYGNVHYYIFAGRIYYPNEFKEVIKINNEDKEKTDLIYELLVTEGLSVEETENILGFNVKEIRRRTYDCIKHKDIDKYNAIRKALNINCKRTVTGITESRIENANKLADHIIENNLTVKDAAKDLGIRYCTAKRYISEVIKLSDKEKYDKVINSRALGNSKVRTNHKNIVNKRSLKEVAKAPSEDTIKAIKPVNKDNVIKLDTINKEELVTVTKVKKTKVSKPRKTTKSNKQNTNKALLAKVNLPLDKQKEIAEQLVSIMEDRNVNIYGASDILCIDIELAKKCMYNNPDVVERLLYNIL